MMSNYKTKDYKVLNHFTAVLLVVICMLLASVIVPAVSIAQNSSEMKQEIVFGGDREYPPFEYLDKKGRPEGFHIDLMRAIGDVIGFEVKFQLGSWDQVYKDFKKERINVIAMFYSKERDQWADFSEPHTILYYEIYSRQKALQSRSLEELSDHEVIVQRGSLIYDYLQKKYAGIRLITVETEADALRLLASGKHDCALVTRIGGRFAIKNYKLSNVKRTSPPLLPQEYRFSVIKGNTELLKKINQGLLTLRETGKYDKIYDKWFQDLVPSGFNIRLALRYAFWFLVPLALLLLLALAWSWLLKRKVAKRTYDLKLELNERKKAQKELDESEKKYRNLVDNALVGIYKSNLKGNLLYANVALARMLEFESPEEIMSESVLKRYKNLNDRDVLMENLKKTDRVEKFETELLTKTGKTKDVLLSALLEGEVLSGMITDITERKEAEKVLRESEKKYRTLYSNIPGMIYRARPDWSTEIISNSEMVCGYSVDEFNTQKVHWIDIIHPDDKQRVFEEGSEITKKPTSIVQDYRILAKDGNTLWVSDRKTSIFKEDGSFVGVDGIVYDITERKEAEEKIQQQLDRISSLRNIDMAITASLDLRLTLKILIDEIMNQLHIDAVNILLFNSHTQTLEYAAGKGFTTEALKKTRLKLGEGFAGKAAMEKRFIHVENLSQDMNSFKRAPLLEEEKFISYYAVPLIAKGHINGVVELFHREVLKPDAEWLDFLDAMATQAAIAIDNAALFNNLQRSHIELVLAYDETLEGWSKAMDMRDRETEGHTQRVTEMTIRIAKEIGIKDGELVHVRRGALLHDMGKMGIPDSILLKPGPLTDEEWEIMRKHPVHAYEMLSHIAFLRNALDIPYCHHEKWDGKGYPRGIKGEQIPLAARIFAVVDVWDALCSDRPYRLAWPKEKVKDYIQEESGNHFDPKVIETFFKMDWTV